MAYNPEQPSLVKKWSAGALQSVKSRYLSLINSKNRSDEGIYTLGVAHKMEMGQVTRISFKMARYLVFVHGGYGKGVGGTKGSSWVDNRGKRKKTNLKSLGAPKKNRKAKAWLSPVLDREVPKLADLLLKEKMESAVNAALLK